MKITIPIRGPHVDYLEEEFDRFLDELDSYGDILNLKNLLDNDIKNGYFESMLFTVIRYPSLEEIKDARIDFFKHNHPHLLSGDCLLELQLTLWPCHVELLAVNAFINRLVRKLSLLVAVSYSTIVDFLAGVIYTNNEFIGYTDVLISTIDNAYDHAARIKWPQFMPVNFNKTLSYFVSNNIQLDGNSSNKLHRAINAFSYTFSSHKESETSHLFWIMVGIEALLAEGSNSISDQIRVKSSLILGEPIEYKKKIKQLYNFRSRLIHGDLDFPAKFSHDFNNFEEEYWDYMWFANSILLALIRKLIEKSANEFKFEYNLLE